MKKYVSSRDKTIVNKRPGPIVVVNEKCAAVNSEGDCSSMLNCHNLFNVK
jgi:hypothetical protein